MPNLSLRRIGCRHAVSVPPSTSVVEAARTMRERDIGTVIVAQGGTPLGILTDRDLALRVVAAGLDPLRVRVSEVMSTPLVTVTDDFDALEAATRMREKKIRRLPIVGPGGDLVGIVTFDDLVHHFGRASSEMSEVVATFPMPYAGG